MAHKNIPVFIPHLGCPNSCVFCNQKCITGHSEFDPSSVKGIIDTALKTINPQKDDVEIAFFGGSFTGIDRSLMVYLLETAYDYIKSGVVESIRLSTRPDYIDSEILDILEKYGVRHIELGIQSMSDKVLKASKRGHSADISENACKLIKARGFSLVGQMMIGLPESLPADEEMTARRLCELGIDAARIYPTVVFADTELDEMALSGKYRPLSVREGAERAASVFEILVENSVPCIRCGLQSQDNLSDESVVKGGAYHPSLGSMAKSIMMRRRIENALTDGREFINPKYPYQQRISVSPENIGDAIGYHSENKDYFIKKYNIYIKCIGDNTLNNFECKLQNRN